MAPVLAAPTPQTHWLARWRRLASVTDGLTQDDPRLPTILTLLEQCSEHCREENDNAFIHIAKQITHLMALPTPPTLPTDIEPPHPPASLH